MNSAKDIFGWLVMGGLLAVVSWLLMGRDTRGECGKDCSIRKDN